MKPKSPTDSQESLARDIGLVVRIGAVPSILEMICDETGMGFAAVARVTDETWMACAVRDNLSFGLTPGGKLDLRTTLCFESRAARAPIVIENFAQDATYCNHHTPAIYNLQSYISVPIILPNGDYFGNLCAIDPRPAKVSDTRVVRMFEVFAHLIGMQIENEQRQWSTEAQLLGERETADLREQFIAVLGHDLRNPLAAVDATAELLIRNPNGCDLPTLGKRLKTTSARMARLIDDVMDFARGRLGSGIPVTIRPVPDLSSVFSVAIDELRTVHPTRLVRTDIAIQTTVNCDAARLQQLVSNLVGNAITHGSAGAPVVVDACVRGSELIMSVTNQGEPIAPHLLTKIFEPYWRPPSSGPRGGLGLGLYICKKIVEAHGGTLDASSSAELGTRFTARIPAD
ncbi:sensor histidine kinase KdpD [Paraburkholderia terrae]|uniref:sensor histidine kinase n=1 Tax=Paraburkholderia terrae TaxID=311230 RepID=UPI001EE1F4D1|nr:GAF domain-containing sensor histidine kinase [Paraburkholderia terrae]GJH04565.1 GAF domain-containing sensor histidine kinase [Paraburkholderia terrae]